MATLSIVVDLAGVTTQQVSEPEEQLLMRRTLASGMQQGRDGYQQVKCGTGHLLKVFPQIVTGYVAAVGPPGSECSRAMTVCCLVYAGPFMPCDRHHTVHVLCLRLQVTIVSVTAVQGRRRGRLAAEVAKMPALAAAAGSSVDESSGSDSSSGGGRRSSGSRDGSSNESKNSGSSRDSSSSSTEEAGAQQLRRLLAGQVEVTAFALVPASQAQSAADALTAAYHSGALLPCWIVPV